MRWRRPGTWLPTLAAKMQVHASPSCLRTYPGLWDWVSIEVRRGAYGHGLLKLELRVCFSIGWMQVRLGDPAKLTLQPLFEGLGEVIDSRSRGAGGAFPHRKAALQP